MRRALTALILLVLLVPAPAAFAADRSDALLDDACTDEKVDGTYSQQDYRKALDKIPADADEYTGCRDVIRDAKLLAAGRHRGGGGGSNDGTNAGAPGTTKPASTKANPLDDATPKERKALATATESAKPVKLGSGLVRPGLASAGATLPAPLAIALALLAAGTLAAGGWAIYTRVLARRAG